MLKLVTRNIEFSYVTCLETPRYSVPKMVSRFIGWPNDNTCFLREKDASRNLFRESTSGPHCIELTRNSNKRRTFNARKTPINNTWWFPTNFCARRADPRPARSSRKYASVPVNPLKFDIPFFVSTRTHTTILFRCVRYRFVETSNVKSEITGFKVTSNAGLRIFFPSSKRVGSLFRCFMDNICAPVFLSAPIFLQ